MKHLRILMLFLVALTFWSCSDDAPSGESIFDTTPRQRNEFEQWILEKYTIPYNISFIYRYKDNETNNSYNVVPPTPEKVKAMAILLKHIWVDAYVELMNGDPTFIKTYAPRVFQLVGSKQYKTDGTETLGTAEGGLKITMFGVNSLDIDNLYIDVTNPYGVRGTDPIDLNYYFFHTLHHEFCHILTQKANYPEEFRTVSVENFRSGDWVNVKDNIAPAFGFVTPYASSEYNEDFAEIYSTYVTKEASAWEALEKRADELVNNTDNEKEDWWEKRSKTAKADMQQKLKLVKEYFEGTWKIDMDKLRKIVLRRSSEVSTLDLRNLPQK